jgi:hypothetical protein
VIFACFASRLHMKSRGARAAGAGLSSPTAEVSPRVTSPPPSHEERVDQFARYWQKTLAKDKRQYINKMERIRHEEEAPPPPPLYMSAEQQSLHQLVFHYVDGLQVHEERVERQKAIHDTRTLLQTVVLMEKHTKT